MSEPELYFNVVLGGNNLLLDNCYADVSYAIFLSKLIQSKYNDSLHFHLYALPSLKENLLAFIAHETNIYHQFFACRYEFPFSEEVQNIIPIDCKSLSFFTPPSHETVTYYFLIDHGSTDGFGKLNLPYPQFVSSILHSCKSSQIFLINNSCYSGTLNCTVKTIIEFQKATDFIFPKNVEKQAAFILLLSMATINKNNQMFSYLPSHFVQQLKNNLPTKKAINSLLKISKSIESFCKVISECFPMIETLDFFTEENIFDFDGYLYTLFETFEPLSTFFEIAKEISLNGIMNTLVLQIINVIFKLSQICSNFKPEHFETIFNLDFLNRFQECINHKIIQSFFDNIHSTDIYNKYIPEFNFEEKKIVCISSTETNKTAEYYSNLAIPLHYPFQNHINIDSAVGSPFDAFISEHLFHGKNPSGITYASLGQFSPPSNPQHDSQIGRPQIYKNFDEPCFSPPSIWKTQPCQNYFIASFTNRFKLIRQTEIAQASQSPSPTSLPPLYPQNQNANIPLSKSSSIDFFLSSDEYDDSLSELERHNLERLSNGRKFISRFVINSKDPKDQYCEQNGAPMIEKPENAFFVEAVVFEAFCIALKNKIREKGLPELRLSYLFEASFSQIGFMRQLYLDLSKIYPINASVPFEEGSKKFITYFNQNMSRKNEIIECFFEAARELNKVNKELKFHPFDYSNYLPYDAEYKIDFDRY